MINGHCVAVGPNFKKIDREREHNNITLSEYTHYAFFVPLGVVGHDKDGKEGSKVRRYVAVARILRYPEYLSLDNISKYSIAKFAKRISGYMTQPWLRIALLTDFEGLQYA